MENFANIKSKINTGEYTVQKRVSKSEVYKIFMDIKDVNGEIIKEVVICDRCKNLYKCSNNCTSNLSRHQCYKKYKEDKEITAVKVQPNSEIKKKCLQLAVQWVVGNCRPFNIVNDVGLYNFLEFILQTGHSFSQNIDLQRLLPHSTTVSRNVAVLYDEQSTILKEELTSIKNIGFAITCDLWTDNFLRTSYIGATVHYIKDGSLLHKVLGMRGMVDEKHTGYNIRIKIDKILNDFGSELNDLVHVVTDRGSNMKAAFKNDNNIYCINHLINNVIEKSIADVEEVISVTNACSKIVKYFKKTGINSSLKTTLKSFTATRWNTIYYLLESVKQNWADITRILEEKGETNRISHLNLGTINDIIAVLKPFEESSKILEGENYPTLHCVIPQIFKLKNMCKQTSSSEVMRKLKEKLLFYIDSVIEVNIFDIHKIALFLFPPTNKLQHFEQSEKSKIHERCKQMASYYENSTHPNVSADLDYTGDDAFSAFVQCSSLPRQEDSISCEITRYDAQTVLYYTYFNLLDWWETHKREYPYLYKLSKLIFATPASSAASERVFSRARHLLSERRTVLGKNPTHVNHIMFLNNNIDLKNISINTVNIHV